MSWKLTLRLIELGVTFVLATALFLAWHTERADRAKLAGELASAQQSLTQAANRQQSRDADLLRTLANIAAEKRTTQTPNQVIQALPQQIPLPQPITWMPKPEPSPTNPTSPVKTEAEAAALRTESSAKPTAPEPQAVIPTPDLKPLYDFALDCNACQARLSAAQSDLADEKSKTTTLTKERDEAIHTAKGGGALQRFARAAKWLLIGAAAGTLAARAIH